MPLSWNEIRSNSLAFSKEWEEKHQKMPRQKAFGMLSSQFWNPRRRVASFEKPVKKSNGQGGFIDLLWKGKLLVEHKSFGKDLDRAFTQALDYFLGSKIVICHSTFWSQTSLAFEFMILIPMTSSNSL